METIELSREEYTDLFKWKIKIELLRNAIEGEADDRIVAEIARLITKGE